MMVMMEMPGATYPDSPMEQDDSAYPCKGCGEILEEGKAFELAGNRWHIDCFRCNTCSTLLDSDANLLLLGDGSLICNNCTYSCSACGDKIEDLAILTGDQAFCASCFRCRNCKKKIENLRYARTSQGIFCMECHEGLMARRRKKSKNSSSRLKQSSNNTMLLDKSLPSLPPSVVSQSAFSPGHETPPSETYSDTPTELPSHSARRPANPRMDSRRDRSPAVSEDSRKETLMLPSTTYRNHRHSGISQRSEISGNGDDFIPMALDLQIAPGPSPMTRHQHFDAQDSTPKSQAADSKALSRDYFNVKNHHSSSRKVSMDYDVTQGSPHAGPRPDSQPSSPHIAYQEKGRQPSSEIIDTIRKRNEQGITSSVGSVAAFDKPNGDSKNGHAENENFRLQEVPKRRRSGTSARNSRSEMPSVPLDTSIIDPVSRSAPASAAPHIREQQVTISASSPNSLQSNNNSDPSPHTVYEPRGQENGTKGSPTSRSSPLGIHLQHVPLRGDSLQKQSTRPPVVSRKEVGNTQTVSTSLAPESGREYPVSAPAQTMRVQGSPTSSVNLNGGKTISKPMESPLSRSHLDLMLAPGRTRDGQSSAATTDSFVSPRAPPNPPMELHHRARNESISTLQSESTKNGDQPASPTLPRYSAAGEFTMEEDMARILGNDDFEQASFLRRVSNSVRHARSYSDRGTRLSKEPKWPKSPLNGASGTMFPREIGSPTSSSPEIREELMWFKNEFRKERQKSNERDQKVAELEAALEGKTAIKEMNNELREKRSTMIVLDTQKELVVRELEVLTEHIAATKKSRDPLNWGQMSNAVLRDFAQSLESLKESFSPQIEDLAQRKSDLVEEVSNLTQLKEQSFQEFEQLSLKNAQLADLNNQLVHQIQGLYKANSVPTVDSVKPQTHGLGIYTHHLKDKSNVSMESRELRPSFSESTYTGSTAVQEQEVEPATILTAPHVVNIRKGQPKKFNWKKGGQNVAKGVTKGLKGAFLSNDTNKYQREGSITEGIPYGAIPQTQEYPSTTKGPTNDPSRQGFGFFGNQKPKPGQKGLSNGSSAAVVAEHYTVLYGSELEQRAEYEKVSVPGIVMRCIQEVELRGMDAEGIYRKSGGNSQIQYVKEGFEHSNDFDISDPEIDINAITSALKQYFRKLPTPLITYPVYDKLLDSTAVIDDSQRITFMRAAVNDLPARHRDCLEFLVFHLARVVEREKENLMTSLNIAVVFAPTIMRPESLTREMSDTQAKNQSVQFLIENCHGVFLGEE